MSRLNQSSSISIHYTTNPSRVDVPVEIDSYRLEPQFTIAILSAVLAISSRRTQCDIFDGGNAKVAGLEGLQIAGSTAYFQMVISILVWGWFLFMLIQMFPIMRTHTVTLLMIWAGFGIAQVFFHSTNKNFPVGLSLSDMMGGSSSRWCAFSSSTSSSKQCVKQGTSMSRLTTYTKMFG